MPAQHFQVAMWGNYTNQYIGANSGLQLELVMCRWRNYIFKFVCS